MGIEPTPSPPPQDEGKVRAAGCLWFIAMKNEKACREISSRGGIAPLVKLLGSKDEETRFNAQGCARFRFREKNPKP